MGHERYTFYSGPVKGKKSKRINNIICLATMWCVWLDSNEVVFNGKVPVVASIVNHIKCLSWG